MLVDCVIVLKCIVSNVFSPIIASTCTKLLLMKWLLHVCPARYGQPTMLNRISEVETHWNNSLEIYISLHSKAVLLIPSQAAFAHITKFGLLSG